MFTSVINQPCFTIIVAYEQSSRGIGYKNRIPWHVPEDMHFFRKTTIETKSSQKKNVVIMGRNTWESLPKKFLSQRINICITSSPKKYETDPPTPDLFFAHSLNDALQYVQLHISHIESVFVIGGAQLYQEAIQHPQCSTILIHELVFEPGQIPPTDSFFPEIPENRYQEIIPIQKPIQIIPRKYIRI